MLRPETIDLRDVVQRAIELSQAAIDAQGVELVVTLPPEPVPTCADPVRLAQVTSNLINNAAKFSNWGGRVAVGLETSRAPGRHHAFATGAAASRHPTWGGSSSPSSSPRPATPGAGGSASDWRW